MGHGFTVVRHLLNPNLCDPPASSSKPDPHHHYQKPHYPIENPKTLCCTGSYGFLIWIIIRLFFLSISRWWLTWREYIRDVRDSGWSERNSKQILMCLQDCFYCSLTIHRTTCMTVFCMIIKTDKMKITFCLKYKHRRNKIVSQPSLVQLKILSANILSTICDCKHIFMSFSMLLLAFRHSLVF